MYVRGTEAVKATMSSGADEFNTQFDSTRLNLDPVVTPQPIRSLGH
jgi:hypothetical protein